MRSLWPLTLRGTGAVVLGIACFILAGELTLPVLTYFALLLFAVVGVSVASLYSMKRGASVTRSLSTDVATVGRESTVRLRRHPLRPAPSPGRMDGRPAEGPGGRGARHLSRARRRGSAAARASSSWPTP